MRPLAAFVLLFGLVAGAPGCSSVYYKGWELLGKEKRDLLRSAFVEMVDDQKDAGETFKSALERVKALTQFDGGELEREYEELKTSYEDAESSAASIDARIAEIEDVSGDLFEEWEREIAQISTPSLAQSSREKLRQSQARYETAHRSMVAARSKMTPVLAVLNDHVLYLKHNLNAQAIGALTGSMGGVEADVAALQSSLDASIREAQSFLATIE